MRSMRILQSTCRAPFLRLMALIYWAQAFSSFAWTGQMRHKLRIRPSTSKFVVFTAFIPWSIKPAIGAKPAGDLQTILWLAMTFGGIIGSVCGGLGLAGLNAEGIFVLLSIFPLLQLLACGTIDDKMAMSIDEGGCNMHEDDDGEVMNIDDPKTTNTITDYFGMLSFLDDEDDYLDNVKLQGISKTRSIYNNDAVPPVSLPWTHDLDIEGIGKVLKTTSHETFENDIQGDEDWIQIGSDGLEKETLELNTTSPKIELNTQVLLTMYPSEMSMEDFLKIDCIPKRRKYPGEDVDLNLDQRGDFVWLWRQQGSHDIKSGWQSLFDAVKRPTILQFDSISILIGLCVMEIRPCITLFASLVVSVRRKFFCSYQMAGIDRCTSLELRPLIWFIFSQFIIPNIYTIMLYYQTTNLQLESSILGASRVLNLNGLMLATFFFNYFLKNLPLRKTSWLIKERGNIKKRLEEVLIAIDV